MEHLWRDLKIAVQRRSPSNLVESCYVHTHFYTLSLLKINLYFFAEFISLQKCKKKKQFLLCHYMVLCVELNV